LKLNDTYSASVFCSELTDVAELRSSGVLRSEQWQFLTDVLGQTLGPIFSVETSVRSYHYSMHNNTEERSFHLLRGQTSNLL